ncbi:LPS O-antigen chain length determinant protein WzzB [Litoribrevibacter euphylliae]|uniref:LPS O-antigen chain length determinant protein WzzB n=1 Tax=Litoribrevibacter euphylliae TaxID=1834034 RepID=A0ABV7HC96_9GAMM
MQKSSYNPTTPYSNHQNDEIDLLELFVVLKQRFSIIAAFTVSFTCLAILYVTTVEPTYEAEAILIPPKQSELYKIDNGINLIKITPNEVFDRFYQTLTSQNFQYQFSERFVDQSQSTELSSVAQQKAFNTFKQQLTVKKSQKKKTDQNYIHLSFQANDAKLAESTLSSYIDEARKRTTADLIALYSSERKSLINRLNKKIEEKTEATKNEVTGEIQRLSGAAQIARSLDLELPTSNTILTTELNSYSLPLYTFGYRALELRIELLQSRESLNIFTKDLAELEAELKSLTKIQLSNQFSVINYQMDPLIPLAPIKPKKALITILAALLGVMMGCLIAIIIHFISKRKEQDSLSVDHGVNMDKLVVSLSNSKKAKESVG